jgi:hypothetical protein
MPSFRHRLTRPQQRIYDRSAAVATVPLRASPRLRQTVSALPQILLSGKRIHVQQAAQVIAEEISRALQVPSVRVSVSGQRPSNTRGELHGLYTPSSGVGTRASIKLWMITAKRGRIVAFKTFLRTLLHEICHHLDYTLLRLPDSFHTEGFYKRESSLFYQVGGDTAAAAARPRTSREKGKEAEEP